MEHKQEFPLWNAMDVGVAPHYEVEFILQLAQ